MGGSAGPRRRVRVSKACDSSCLSSMRECRLGSEVGRIGHLPASGGFRTMVNSLTPGTAAPPMVRSTDCQLARSLPSRVMMFVADACWPSCRTPSALITHWSPLRVQYPSPKPPSESKIQVLNWPRVPADPLRARQHRLAPRLHGEVTDQEVAVVGPLAGGLHDRVPLSLTHSPISHSSSFRRSWGVRSSAVSSRMADCSQWPSRLT